MKRRLACLGFMLATTWFCVVASQVHAGPILGSQVTGGLYFGNDAPNWFNPVNGSVPAGFLNTAGATVTISASGVEFGHKDGRNQDSAEFTGTQVIIKDIIQGDSARFRMVFTNAAFLGATLTEVSDTFSNGGVTANLDGETITLTWAGTGGVLAFTPFTKGTPFTAVYSVTEPPAAASSPVAADVATAPEPTSVLVFGGALLAALALLRKRAFPIVSPRPT